MEKELKWHTATKYLTCYVWILQQGFVSISLLVNSILSYSSVDITSISTFGHLLFARGILVSYKRTIAIVNEEGVVGHIPICLSKLVSMIVSLLGSHLEAEVNRGGGYDLEVPWNYCLAGQEKTLKWFKKNMTVILKEHTAVVQKF